MIKNFSAISDQELLTRISGLAKTENETTVELLLYLGELEERKLYLSLGYSSLFDYCQRKLLYSEPAAVRRIKAARCIKAFPEVEGLLLERAVSLSTVCLFAPLLNLENRVELLQGVKGKSKTEVERFLALYRPVTQKPVEKIRVVVVKEKPAVQPQISHLFDIATKNTATEASKEKDPEEKTAAGIAEPVRECFQLQFSVDPETLGKLNRAKVLVGQGLGRNPSLEEVFKAALGEYLKAKDPLEREKRRVTRSAATALGASRVEEAKGSKEKKELPSPVIARNTQEIPKNRSRHIPRSVYDKVFIRDGGRCSFVGPDGTRCNSTAGLQVDHIYPFGLGGESSESNLRLTCSAHNLFAAEKVYGRGKVERYKRAKSTGS